MQNRPTETITLPTSGLEVEYKKFLTVRETEQIQIASLRMTKSTLGADGKFQSGELVYEHLHDASHKRVELQVVRVGDVQDNILDYILDNLPQDDYEVLTGKLTENDKKKSVEKPSSSVKNGE